MILHPAILALLLGSGLASLMVFTAAVFGARIMAAWEPESGSELQLTLERRTYLVSTLVSSALAFQTVSLFLFVFTADRLHPLFTGAMCAAGTLNADPYGYPLLVLKLVDFLLAGVWLVVNHADNSGYDYPLIRFKYAFLFLLAPWLLVEFICLAAFCAGLHTEVITSCCGSLFSVRQPGVAGDLASLPYPVMRLAFPASIFLTAALGLVFLRAGRGTCLFSAASLASLAVAIASLISFISLYVYQLPTHHCPFCLLQREYGYVGYPLYATLLTGAVSGLAVGVLQPFRRRGSMARVIPPLQRRLALVTILLYLIFSAIVCYEIAFSSLRLGV